MIRGIEVSSYSKATTRPDTVEFWISIRFKRETPHEAQELTARTTVRVLAELRAIGVEEAGIETREYPVRPVYEWEKDSRAFKGYESSNEPKIKTAKLNLSIALTDSSLQQAGLAILGLLPNRRSSCRSFCRRA